MDETTRHCLFCSQPFVTTDGRKRYCSKAHADKGRYVGLRAPGAAPLIRGWGFRIGARSFYFGTWKKAR